MLILFGKAYENGPRPGAEEGDQARIGSVFPEFERILRDSTAQCHDGESQDHLGRPVHSVVNTTGFPKIIREKATTAGKEYVLILPEDNDEIDWIAAILLIVDGSCRLRYHGFLR